jgi:transcriptional regulator with XRE-family HTH domain
MVSTQFIPASLSDNRVFGQAVLLGQPMGGSFTLPGMRDASRTEFGQRLVDARKHAKLTQEQVASAAGMSQGTLGELEKDGHGSTYTVKIAMICGVRPEWLAEGEGEMVDVFAWPFQRIDRDRILCLDETDLAVVEGAIITALGHTKAPSTEALKRLAAQHKATRKRPPGRRAA